MPDGWKLRERTMQWERIRDDTFTDDGYVVRRCSCDRCDGSQWLFFVDGDLAPGGPWYSPREAAEAAERFAAMFPSKASAPRRIQRLDGEDGEA